MIRRAHFQRLLTTLSLSAVLLPEALEACTACAGRSDDAMARGMNMGIFALLIVIVSVLVGFASFAVFLARRAARFPLPPASTGDGKEVEADTEPDTDAHPAEPISQPTK